MHRSYRGEDDDGADAQPSCPVTNQDVDDISSANVKDARSVAIQTRLVSRIAAGGGWRSRGADATASEALQASW
jgi:hypothetical protein